MDQAPLQQNLFHLLSSLTETRVKGIVMLYISPYIEVNITLAKEVVTSLESQFQSEVETKPATLHSADARPTGIEDLIKHHSMRQD